MFRSHSSLCRCLLLFASAGCLWFFAGCTPVENSASRRGRESQAESRAQLALQDRIDQALSFTIQQRRLDSQDQAAWQVVHGILAFGKEFPLKHEGTDVKALDYLLAGGQLKGWNLSPGDVLNAETNRRGIRTLVERGTITGQGHRDQWLGYLSQTGLPLETPIVVEGEQHTLEDYLLQIERDVYQNVDNEFSWTLMALASYRPTDYVWVAGDGSGWSVAKVVEIELAQDLADSPCGGMHRLSGLAMARAKHLSDGGKLEGVWADCDRKINDCLAKIQEYQSADGCFSVNYTERPGTSIDLPNAMHCSGHTLEFVILATDDEHLRQAWIDRAVGNMCDLFYQTEKLDLECGALYHAAHALALYRQRIFGERKYLDDATAAPATSATESEPGA